MVYSTVPTDNVTSGVASGGFATVLGRYLDGPHDLNVRHRGIYFFTLEDLRLPEGTSNNF